MTLAFSRAAWLSPLCVLLVGTALGCATSTSDQQFPGTDSAPGDTSVVADGADTGPADTGSGEAGDSTTDLGEDTACDPGKARCSGVCVDTTTDHGNCGSCGKACAAKE